ncbi:hypothetical protein MASR2M70_05380 [Bacillota bacterium]
MKYVNLIIDNNSNSTDRLYTYGSTVEDLKPGDKVRVTFGRGNKEYEAYVHSLEAGPDPKIKKYKQIIEKDPDISLPKDAIEISSFMKQRFFCRHIDGIKCFIPAGAAPKRKARKDYFEGRDVEARPLPALTEEQEEAVKELIPFIEKRSHRIFMVRGVTSSGKTEVYISVIAECIKKGRTAIMLVPEISLTTQTIRRFQERFGSGQLAVLHSKLTKGERYDQWMRIKRGEAKVVIGARSAIFAPLENIGVIILDEEHETTYKSDMTPKYDTAEVAIKRAEISGALVLLGSATPSMATSYKAGNETYGRIILKNRYNKNPLPAVEIVDMRVELKEGNKSIFSRALYREARSCLDEGRQIILFLNRRGYSTFVSCRSCGYVAQCGDCGISMTYHKSEDQVVCHYCGKRIDAPKTCPGCGSKYIRYFGVGTEKVEEAALETFTDSVIKRLDLDTVSKKGSIDAILKSFGKGETNILIGTQIVAKGLDFSNVGLVGIISADVTLNIPDFRSSERTFQLITQAAGRAGRGDHHGKVVIQSYTPEHYAIRLGAGQDYEAFYGTELKFREKMAYPPFCDIIYIVLAAATDEEAKTGAGKIRDSFLRRVGKEHYMNILGPRAAPISKMGDLYRYQLFIKCAPENWDIYRDAVLGIKDKVSREKSKEWTFSADINPFGFL